MLCRTTVRQVGLSLGTRHSIGSNGHSPESAAHGELLRIPLRARYLDPCQPIPT